ncbi:hypothetical protein F4814DRAFT_358842 [Daldinia grandis]|nr:hypothetical protein F4814DRAFT_358842 [Daldinia grandis]
MTQRTNPIPSIPFNNVLVCWFISIHPLNPAYQHSFHYNHNPLHEYIVPGSAALSLLVFSACRYYLPRAMNCGSFIRRRSCRMMALLRFVARFSRTGTVEANTLRGTSVSWPGFFYESNFSLLSISAIYTVSKKAQTGDIPPD